MNTVADSVLHNPESSSLAKEIASSNLPMMDKIIVAIHGIGSQLRSDTIRSVAHRFGERSSPPLPVMPLGYFNIGKTDQVRLSRLDAKPEDDVARIGFAEIFWADIPGQVVKANDTLEETKAWGRTVVSRAEATYRKSVPDGKLKPDDFALGIGVVEEIIETVSVLENLLTIADKAGVFKFELGSLLRDYVGDVQLVTDFPFYRKKIIYRFHTALAQIVSAFHELYPDHPDHLPEIYIVAHSEGTVISLLGLFEALAGRVVIDPESKDLHPKPVDTTWVNCVRGYMTIGSPIDKHIALWPKLWEGLDIDSHLDSSGSVVPTSSAKMRPHLKQQIKWRNYYDYADPIGFKLETAVALLEERRCAAFEFSTEKHDFGFSRSLVPGKAHNDYWNDSEVFGHFIDDVVVPNGKAIAPKSQFIADKVSLLLPYVLTFILHLAAVFIIYKAVTFDSQQTLSITESAAKQVFLLGGLLTSITVGARLPRLVKTSGWRWEIAAFLLFMIGALPCSILLPESVVEFLGKPLVGAVPWLDRYSTDAGRVAILITAFVVASSGWVLPRKPKLGRRVVLGFGVALIATILVLRILDTSSGTSYWHVVLAGLGFLYLWWLGILMFDLTFVWHRYIRRSVAVETLFQWRKNRDAKPHTYMGLGNPV